MTIRTKEGDTDTIKEGTNNNKITSRSKSKNNKVRKK